VFPIGVGVSQSYDVIVVGGGFAGLTAARELRRSERRVVVLEARDRLGGRAWTSEFCGVPVELGGTWVHWLQPHVWAELSRYGLGISGGLEPDHATLFVEGQPQPMTVAELETLVNDAGDQLIGDASVAFERPYDPSSWDVSAIDGLSIADRMDALGFDPVTWSAADSAFSGSASAYCREVGLAPLVHWQALSGFDTELAWECTEGYVISTGATSLIDAIAADGDFDIKLQSPVEAIEQSPTRVEVRLRDGERLEARAVVVAVPINTLGQIGFAPELSPRKRAMASERQASHGFKIFVRVRGPMSELVLAPSTSPITDIGVHARTAAGDTICLAFGPDTARLDPTDTAAITNVVSRLVPDHEVLETFAHDWTADEFSRGTWSSYRPNQITRYLAELQQPEARVFLAGSDITSGANGNIDGASESGLHAARNVRRLLAED
jgi:monoamine oxidase